MPRDAFQHLALAGRLMDWRTVGMLERADCVGNLRAFGEQIDQRQIDLIDPLAQLGEISPDRAGFRGRGGVIAQALLTESAGLFNVIRP